VSRWAPQHLKALRGTMPDNEWVQECRAWRKAQVRAPRDERRARPAAGCLVIDASDAPRNEKIVAKRALGTTLGSIAEQHGITRQRVLQIVKPKPRDNLRNMQRLDRLLAIWAVCPASIRAAFLERIGADEPPGTASASGTAAEGTGTDD
jgi:hypothetical protein